MREIFILVKLKIEEIIDCFDLIIIIIIVIIIIAGMENLTCLWLAG